MKFNLKDVNTAIGELAMLRWFPAEEAPRVAIRTLLAKMVPSLEALRWLVDEMLLVGEWQGPRELRAVLCRKYTPADGVRVGGPVAPSRQQVEAEVGAAIQRYHDRCNAEYEANLAKWKAEAARQIPGECEPLALPVLKKPMPRPKVRDWRRALTDVPSTAELEAQMEREMGPTLSDAEREEKAEQLRRAVRERGVA